MNTCECCGTVLQTGRSQLPFNPDQMVFLINDTRFPKSYTDGYDTGLTWNVSWRPGGPMVYASTRSLSEDDPDSRASHDVWHEGFKHGFVERLKDPAFALWHESFRHKSGHHIYPEPQSSAV